MTARAGEERMNAASAPFLDQSNINLAYPYAEQPLIFETQPSVELRYLASVSLVRPAVFEPEREFDGFSVAVELPYGDDA